MLFPVEGDTDFVWHFSGYSGIGPTYCRNRATQSEESIAWATLLIQKGIAPLKKRTGKAITDGMCSPALYMATERVLGSMERNAELGIMFLIRS